MSEGFKSCIISCTISLISSFVLTPVIGTELAIATASIMGMVAYFGILNYRSLHRKVRK